MRNLHPDKLPWYYHLVGKIVKVSKPNEKETFYSKFIRNCQFFDEEDKMWKTGKIHKKDLDFKFPYTNKNEKI